MDDVALSGQIAGQEIVSGEAQVAAAQLPLATRILYGVGEAGNAIKSFAFGLFLLFYYTTVRGVPGTLVGVATAVGLVWDAAIDPLIGHISDRLSSRWGRRHPLMALGAIGMGVTFYAIFRPPAGLGVGALFAWLLITSILLRTFNSLFTVPYHALGAELTPDYDERTAVTGTRAAFALGGTLIAAAASFAVFFPDHASDVDPRMMPQGYAAMGLAFGSAMTLLALLTTWGTYSYSERFQARRIEHGQTPLGLWAGLRVCLRNGPFVALTLSASLFFLASVINATVAIHYLTYYAGITESRALSLFQLAFYAGALPGVVAWLWLSRRAEKHQIYVLATLIVAGLMVAAYALVGRGRVLGEGNVLALVGGNALAGFFASALWVLPPSMVADVTDLDALRTGRRREGVFFGVYSFSQQVAASLAILVSGVLVDHFAGLVPGQAEQSWATIERLALTFGPIPAVIVVAATGLILAYRLDRRRWRAIRAALDEARS
ncbi:MAG: MFS transporter [Anaerolineae bacterium]